MFKKLTDFGYKRTALQAAGFYFAYLVLVLLLSATSAGVVDIFFQIFSHANADTDEDAFNRGMLVGSIAASISCTFISLVIFKQKRFSFVSLFGLIVTLPASFFGGIFGMIPVAFLTTLQSGEKK